MKKRTRLTPLQSVVLGFLLITILGAFLLTLPISNTKGVWQPFIDALFTSASCISTTGLVVQDTGSFYNLFGQIVMLIIFQIGGIGFMVFIVLIAYALNRKPNHVSKASFKESMAGAPIGNTKSFAKAVILFTLAFELGGALLLTLYWMSYYPLPRALWLGFFHSVSAFCTAGFGLFPDSLVSCQASVYVNLVEEVISIAGAVGFFVLFDMYRQSQKTIARKWPHRLSLHTKMVLTVTAVIVVIGTFVVFFSELGRSNLPIGRQLMNAFFQAVSAETTTGFNTVDVGGLMAPSLFFLMILMFIGASPGSTGGGIKTTTFGVIILFVLSLLKRSPDANIYKRRIPPELIDTSFAIASLSLLLVAIITLALVFTEKGTFMQILFEVISAFGNGGLSTGITANLTPVGRVLLSLTMFIGRIGPLAIGFSLLGEPKKVSFKFAREDIYVG